MQAKVRQILNDVLWGFMNSPYLRWMGCRNKLSLQQHKPLGATRKCPHILPSRADKNGLAALHCSRSHSTAACLAHTAINPFPNIMSRKCLQTHGQCWVLKKIYKWWLCIHHQQNKEKRRQDLAKTLPSVFSSLTAWRQNSFNILFLIKIAHLVMLLIPSSPWFTSIL